MQRRIAGAVVTVVAVAVVAAGCGGQSGTAKLVDRSPTTVPSTPTTTSPPSYVSYFATAKGTVGAVDVFGTPTDPAPKLTLPNPWLVDPDIPTSTVSQVFLVMKDRKPTTGWVHVLLPVKPNGSTGWIHADDVVVAPNPYHITVKLADHTITVTDGTSVAYRGPIAIGATDPPLPDVGKPTPTPTGEYYLRVLLQAPDPTTVYGPYAYGLSSHSDALDTFAGGDGEIGIHGNNDASVLGKSITHGCIRMDNAAITMLSKRLPLGTPVDIVA